MLFKKKRLPENISLGIASQVMLRVVINLSDIAEQRFRSIDFKKLSQSRIDRIIFANALGGMLQSANSKSLVSGRLQGDCQKFEECYKLALETPLDGYNERKKQALENLTTVGISSLLSEIIIQEDCERYSS